ncbi:MAG: hypothetical protein RMY34_32920 [Aulosira sp. DedQUE10]|nr:hypothetical protein [Aulosira sp. DedQUE10]
MPVATSRETTRARWLPLQSYTNLKCGRMAKLRRSQNIDFNQCPPSNNDEINYVIGRF